MGRGGKISVIKDNNSAQVLCFCFVFRDRDCLALKLEELPLNLMKVFSSSLMFSSKVTIIFDNPFGKLV